MELFIILTFIAISVLIVYFFFRSDRSRASISAAEITSTPLIHHPQAEPFSPPQAPEEIGPYPQDNLKEQIRYGLLALFTEPTANKAESSHAPFAYGSIAPSLLEQAKQHVESIHSFRTVHSRLQQSMNDPALNVMSTLSSMIVADPVLSGKVLKIVNSAYYGRTEKVNSIGHAVILLGLVRLREIIYREGMLEMFKVNDPEKDALIEAFWRHATITSICAVNLRGLFPGLDQGTLFTSGLIHDVGKIILVRMGNNPEYSLHSTIQDEDRIFGINHVITGKIALEQWGFSDLMQSTIEHHHSPAFAPLESLRLGQQATQYLTVLFLANQLAKMVHPGQDYLPVEPLHPSYYPLVEQEMLTRTALDNVLLSRLCKSEAFIT